MAEIPVEKKSNSLIWWLLLLAGLAALIWFLLANDDEVDPVASDDDIVATETIDPEVTEVEALSGVAALGTLGTMVGRDITLDGVEVNRVIGDMAFTVGEGADETLVRFDEVPTPDTPREGLVDVNPGSTVSITGNVRDLDVSEMPESVRADLDGTNAAYIFASRVDVENGGETP